jgi:hypothetical protein
MKRIAMMAMCLFPVTVLALGDQSKQFPGSGVICVERQEDEGAVNIYPVSLRVDGVQSAIFLGGRAACLYLRPGNHELFLRWNRFDWLRNDHGLGNPSESSAVVSVKVERRAKVLLKINSTRDKANNPHWRLAREPA